MPTTLFALNRAAKAKMTKEGRNEEEKRKENGSFHLQ